MTSLAMMSCLKQHVTVPYPENTAVLANFPDPSAESSTKQLQRSVRQNMLHITIW